MSKLAQLRDAWLDMLIGLSRIEVVAAVAVVALWIGGVFGDVTLDEAILISAPVVALILGRSAAKTAKAMQGQPENATEARAQSAMRVGEAIAMSGIRRVELQNAVSEVKLATQEMGATPMGWREGGVVAVAGADMPLPAGRASRRPPYDSLPD